MRIWDVEPKLLCDKHLLGEHRELHAIWVILTENKRGYRSHPEVKRWEGKLRALYRRHSVLVEEMKIRGFRHQSPLADELALGREDQNIFLDTIAEQEEILRIKPCKCFSVE
jgi:hypothetical protein